MDGLFFILGGRQTAQQTINCFQFEKRLVNRHDCVIATANTQEAYADPQGKVSMNMVQPIDTTRLVFQTLLPKDGEHPLLGAIASFSPPEVSCQLCGWEGPKSATSAHDDAREGAKCPSCLDNLGLHEAEYVVYGNAAFKEEPTLITQVQVAVERNQTVILTLDQLLNAEPSTVVLDRLLVQSAGTLAVAGKSMLRYTPVIGFVGLDSAYLSCFERADVDRNHVRVLRIQFLVSHNHPL